MKTIDNIVDQLKIIGIDNLSVNIPLRDKRILKNIAHLMSLSSYITESQGNLLIKILKENLEHLNQVYPSLADDLKHISWMYTFRVVNKKREVTIEKKENGDFCICVRYDFDKEIRKKLAILNKNIGTDRVLDTSKYPKYNYTEKTVTTIYDTMKTLNFRFSTEFMESYEKIKNIDTTKVLEKFEYENFFNERLEKYYHRQNISFEDLEKIHILDQKIRYQYQYIGNFSSEEKEKLRFKIANRKMAKIFIGRHFTSLRELITNILSLKRDKILLVFDEYNIKDCVHYITLLSSIVHDLNIQQFVGIYFRFDNREEGITFNKIISNNKLNQRLDSTTKIAAISNGKIPKFLLNSDWYPDAVISLTNQMRNNRTDVYCNFCDLIVYYDVVKPLTVTHDEIL